MAGSAMTINAYTDYEKDKDYNHCFCQRDASTLYFDVTADSSADTINFILWNIKDPVKPYIAESSMDMPIKGGKIRIAVGPDRKGSPLHLGPGPYMAVLTTSTSAVSDNGKRRTLDNGAYYYETWKSDHCECHYR